MRATINKKEKRENTAQTPFTTFQNPLLALWNKTTLNIKAPN